MPVRQHRPFAKTFAEEFQESLLVSPVPLSDMISWGEIESSVENKAEALPIIEDETIPEEFLLQEFVRDEQAKSRCNLLFELLHFQNANLLSRDVTWYLNEFNFSNPESDKGEQFAADLAEVGAHHLLQSREKLKGHIEQYELRRNNNPNRTGHYFEQLVGEELQEITTALPAMTRLVAEDRIAEQFYHEQRVFDYVLYEDNDPQIVFEVKYFQNSGSIIQESIRSFNRISTKLRNAGIEFVWIADGEGWKEVPESIEKAYQRVIDIYNHEQLVTSLEADIREFLEHGAAVSEDEVKLDQNMNLNDFE